MVIKLSILLFAITQRNYSRHLAITRWHLEKGDQFIGLGESLDLIHTHAALICMGNWDAAAEEWVLADIYRHLNTNLLRTIKIFIFLVRDRCFYGV